MYYLLKINKDPLPAGGIASVATAKAESTLDHDKVTRGRNYTWSCEVNNTIPKEKKSNYNLQIKTIALSFVIPPNFHEYRI